MKISYHIFFALFVCMAFCQNISAQGSLNSLLSQLSQAKTMPEKITALERLGLAYQRDNAHKKAIEYFEQARQLQIQNKTDITNQIPILENMSYSLMELPDLAKAKAAYKDLLVLQKKAGKKQDEVNTLHKLAEINEANSQYEEALVSVLECLEVNKDLNDPMAIANTYNNLGFLYRKLNDNAKSIDSFNNALAIFGKMNRENPNQQVPMLTNLGVTYSYLGRFDNAAENFAKAVKLAEKQGNQYEAANLDNYLAANFFISAKSNQAISYAEKAIQKAQNIPNGEGLLEVSYKILSEVYQKEKDLGQYQKYNKLYQETRDKVNKQQQVRQQQILQSQIIVEQKEGEIKSNIASKEKQDLALSQLQLEKKNSEQQIILLRKEQETKNAQFRNQQLERERIEQALLLTKQVAESEKQKAEAERQKAEAERKDAELEIQRAEAKVQQANSEKKRLEAEQRIKNEREEKESAQKEAAAGRAITILSAVVAVLVLGALIYGFFTYRRVQKQKQAIEVQSKELQIQSEQIGAQNEELRQNQEEILAQRDAIEDKNMVLNEQNQKIGSSINAAMTIQQAVLPHETKIRKFVRDFFVIFRPRDVVSGDFYWVESVDDKIFAAAVDCTGHGVPGAFMSIIGNTMLNKIVQVYKIQSPAKILEQLHQEIKGVLQQDATDNRYGMDLSLCMIEPAEKNRMKVTFAGAKRPLYYVEDGQNQVFILKGDRKAVGGDQNESLDFTDQVIYLPKGSLLYLSSDGFVDQNNLERIKLGESKFRYILSSTANQPMSVQKKALEGLLDEYQKDTEQRDDILLLGLKL